MMRIAILCRDPFVLRGGYSGRAWQCAQVACSNIARDVGKWCLPKLPRTIEVTDYVAMDDSYTGKSPNMVCRFMNIS
jgi:hypothetical protein